MCVCGLVNIVSGVFHCLCQTNPGWLVVSDSLSLQQEILASLQLFTFQYTRVLSYSIAMLLAGWMANAVSYLCGVI